MTIKQFRMIFLLVLGSVFFDSTLFACRWCIPNAPIPELEQLKADDRDQQQKSALIARWEERRLASEAVDVVAREPLPAYLEGKSFDITPPKTRFYSDYLSKYYPRADAITCILLQSMCEKACEDAVRALTFLMHKSRCAHYFVSSEKTFTLRLIHLEIMQQQLTALVASLERTYVNKETGMVMLAQQGERVSQNIIQYWREQGRTTVDDLVALYTDYIIMLCYISIKFHNLPESFASAYSYCNRLGLILRQLQGTTYEQNYTQKYQLFRQLVKMLQVRLWGNL